jgi:hypothetical protein
MNSYKFNSTSNYILRYVISNFFKINHTEVYKKVKSIDNDIITTDNNKKYRITLVEI